MYEPSKISGHPNCYSTSLPSSVHAAAGPMNHWFYLLAEGTNPGNGKPTSPTCNSTTLTGIGHQDAGKIFYNAMLSKTSGMSYQKWRIATLAAAKNLDSQLRPARQGEGRLGRRQRAGPVRRGHLRSDRQRLHPGGLARHRLGQARETATATVNTVIGNGSRPDVRLTADAACPAARRRPSTRPRSSPGNSSTLTIATTSTTRRGHVRRTDHR